jgi:hypothetical protein
MKYIAPCPYESQRDNIMDGGVTCAVTSLSMLLQALNPEIKPHEEDRILTDLKSSYPANHKSLREDFIFLRDYAKNKYGVALRYVRYNRDEWIGAVTKTAATHKPFMTSTSNGLTKFGHIVVVRGFDDANGLRVCVNDPYGKYPYKSTDGEAVLYPVEQFPDKDGSGRKYYHTLSEA